jgi:hypothetical protein
VDCVLASGLLTLFFLAFIQLTLVLHVRNPDRRRSFRRQIRHADRGAADARPDGHLISVALSPSFANEVSMTETSIRASPRWR